MSEQPPIVVRRSPVQGLGVFDHIIGEQHALGIAAVLKTECLTLGKRVARWSIT